MYHSFRRQLRSGTVGHVELGKYFCRLFNTNELRLIPPGNPWQKPLLKATPKQRIAMLECAFEPLGFSFTIDSQEIDRPGATYTIDTLRSIRHEVGPDVSLIFLMGADQLLRLDTWHNWRQLFDLTNIAVSAHPDLEFAGTDSQGDSRRVFTPFCGSGKNHFHTGRD